MFFKRLNKNIARVLFVNYSYVISLFHLLLNLSPPILRKLLLKLSLKKLGSQVFIDTNVYFRYPSRVYIGDNVSINRGCEFYPSLYNKEAVIKIGNNIRFGPNVRLLAAGHDHTKLDLPDVAEKIIIKDNVWIGGNVIITKGVIIEEGTVVAAGAVVTKSTVPYGIYAGIPAKKIKDRIIIDDDKIQ